MTPPHPQTPSSWEGRYNRGRGRQFKIFANAREGWWS
uniref:Uncharacterized protein n=1 Tax=Siphoviridae sp. ctQLz13 TaxID=2825492 RepID=A0A8S5NUK2_9CAUD|nr:MAG TPA: hypothetical protein [Siphoviridae sp. ctQLz13]